MAEGNLSGRGRKPTTVTGSTFRHKVARRIRERRLELQLRAEDVAESVGTLAQRPINVQTWYHWEKAEHPFDIDLLGPIAEALKCSPRDLIPQQ